MKFNSQICTTRSQSEALLKLGLKKETADMTHHYLNSIDSYELKDIEFSRIMHLQELTNKNPILGRSGDDLYAKDIPAWGLHRLIEMMPKCVRTHSSGDDSSRLHSYVPKLDYQGVTIENIDEILADFYQHTDLFDNIIDCIEWLIKEGYFNKEYLV